MYFFEPVNPRKRKGNVEWRRENVIAMSAAKKQSFAGVSAFGKRTIASLHLARFIICHPL